MMPKPNWSTRLVGALRRVAGLPGVERESVEMREEMQFHIDMHAAKLRAAGMADDEARRAALVSFGGTSRWSEDGRDEIRSRPVEEFLRDIAYAMRSLRRTPTFTAAVLLSLALGIGATSTVYTVTERVVLRPLGYGDGGALAMVWTTSLRNPADHGVDSYDDFKDWTTNNPDIQYASLFNIWGPTLTGAGDPEPLVGSRVSAQFFDVFGVRPMLGRGFRADEDIQNGPRVVVMAASLWKRRFHSDSSIVGKTILLNGFPYSVVGVMPPGFRDPEPFWKHGAEVWRPLSLVPFPQSRIARYLRVVARFKPGVSIEKASTDLNAVMVRMGKDHPQADSGRHVAVVPIQEQVVGQSRAVLYAALAAAVCLLLIVCSNVASLVLARNEVRAPEIAVRSAMGAVRGRITRLLFTESLLLGIVGGACGLLLAVAATALLRRGAPADLPRAEEIAVDGWVLAVTTLISAAAALTFGLVPSIRGSRSDLATMLQSAGGRTTRGAGRSAMVVAQLALSLVLLTAAGLLAKSVYRAASVPLGIQSSGLLSFRVTLPNARYPNDTSQRAFFSRLLSSVREQPSVVSAATASFLPLTDLNDLGLPAGGAASRPSKEGIDTHVRAVSPGYFMTMGIPLVGRDFTEADSTGAPRVVILNHTAATYFFGSENPIGRLFLTSPTDSAPATVVGIAGDVRFGGPLSTDPAREMFQPHAQYTWNANAIVVKARRDPTTLVPEMRRVVHSLDANLPLEDVTTLDDRARHYTARQRFFALVFGVFAGAALLLSAVGVYGTVAYGVVQRRREIAIRIALGARDGQILWSFIARTGRLIAVSTVVGLAGALALSRAVASLLYGVTPRDSATLVGACGLLAIVAVIASWWPAWRARRVQPANVLRGE